MKDWIHMFDIACSTFEMGLKITHNESFASNLGTEELQQFNQAI